MGLGRARHDCSDSRVILLAPAFSLEHGDSVHDYHWLGSCGLAGEAVWAPYLGPCAEPEVCAQKFHIARLGVSQHAVVLFKSAHESGSWLSRIEALPGLIVENF